jgi:hypothetical protein
LLLGAPACAAPAIRAASPPVSRAPVWTPPVREKQQDAACMHRHDKRLVSFTLGPRPTLVDAVAWASSLVCEPFLLPGPLVAENRRLLMIGPEQMPMEDAYRFFLDALESAELVVARDGNVQRIAEIGADVPRGAEMPGPDAGDADQDSYVTVLLHLKDLPPEERARVCTKYHGDICTDDVRAPDQETIVITDVRSEIERLLGHPIGR